MPCLYSTLSLPRRNKQTMTVQMDDQTDEQMDDETDGCNDASRRPLLYVIWLDLPRDEHHSFTSFYGGLPLRRVCFHSATVVTAA